jgi:hypothetical protein
MFCVRRNKNVITKTSNEDSCGFSTVIETLEAMSAIKAKISPKLSLQQLIDCNDFNLKCDGSDPCRLLNWLHSNRIAIQHESDYNLSNDSNKCKLGEENVSCIKVKDYSCDK